MTTNLSLAATSRAGAAAARSTRSATRAIDERLQECYLNGQEVIYRHLLKTPEDIEGIKRSAAINVGVLDMVAERIAPA